MKPYKFVKTATDKEPNTPYTQILSKIESNSDIKKLTDREFNQLQIIIENAKYNKYVYKIAGWAYDLKPYLNRYFVVSDMFICIEYNVNKTLLRKVFCGKIYEIVHAPAKNFIA